MEFINEINILKLIGEGKTSFDEIQQRYMAYDEKSIVKMVVLINGLKNMRYITVEKEFTEFSPDPGEIQLTKRGKEYLRNYKRADSVNSSESSELKKLLDIIYHDYQKFCKEKDLQFKRMYMNDIDTLNKIHELFLFNYITIDIKKQPKPISSSGADLSHDDYDYFFEFNINKDFLSNSGKKLIKPAFKKLSEKISDTIKEYT